MLHAKRSHLSSAVIELKSTDASAQCDACAVGLAHHELGRDDLGVLVLGPAELRQKARDRAATDLGEVLLDRS